MRRFVLFVAALTPIILTVGCEDGPAQTYSPAPNGAASVWNGTYGAPSFTGSATAEFDASFGGQTANDTCTGPQKKTLWANLFQEPIQIPGLAGGVDIAGGSNGDGASGFVAGQPFTYDPTKETWSGATVEQAEAILCQGTADSIYTGVTTTIGWGENAPNYEFSAEYNANNRQITDLLFQYGYIGSISATSPDGTTTYSIGLNNLPIQKSVNGGPATSVELDWTDATTLQATVNSIYAAFMFTYAPTFPVDPDCYGAGHCIIGNNYTEGGYMFFTPINIAFFVDNTLAPQPAASTMGLVDLGLLKLLPFSLANTLLQLDHAGTGPTVSLNNIGGGTANCNYFLGQDFGTFNSTCVQVFGSDTAQNTIAENKLFGGIAHSDEAYQFDIEGIDPQFTATLADDAVLADNQRPVATDIAYRLTYDQYGVGPVSNDFTNNDPTMPQDLHGIGMLTLEWANLVQQYMRANYGVTSQLGDATCIKFPTTNGCSGIEGIVTTAPPGLAPMYMRNSNALGLEVPIVTDSSGNPVSGITNDYNGGLKPSTWSAVYCHGLGNPENGTGYAPCEGGGAGPLSPDQSGGGYLFDQMQFEIQEGYGANHPNIAPELLSRRFYFQQWLLAVVKYFKVANNPNAPLLANPTPDGTSIDEQVVDPSNLFFDSAGGGFETGTYVERSTVNSGMQAPTALSVTTNLTTSVINDFDFQRYNFRGERALYTALTTTLGDLPGAEPLYVSNIVGSSVLDAAYNDFAANTVYGFPDVRYECATNNDPTNTDCIDPYTGAGPVVSPQVTDALGPHALYAGYQPAFGLSILAIAANGSAPPPSPITINPNGFELIQSAQVTMPIYAPSAANPSQNPFDPTTWVASPPTITVLVPYLPKGANVGFPVTIDGSRDKFYNTYNIDLTGTTVNGNVDYEYLNSSDADGGVTTSLVIRAFETQNFLGLVFACNGDLTTGGDGNNILSVRMYDNAQTILDWIGANSQAATACGVEIKYSIYGNDPDYISFLNSGVRFGLNPGFGGSVVSDVTLFDPNVVASLGQ